MARILVTGFNARMASPRRATRDTCFAALIVEALRDMGYTVDHRDPSVGEELSEYYDHVFVGIASPLAVSSNRAYGALSAIGMTWPNGRLTLFLDDPDVAKIVHGLSSLENKPEQLTKDFFAARADYAQACDPSWQDWLLNICALLRSAQWPTLLVPAFDWANVVQVLGPSMPNTMQGHAVQCDPSAYVMAHPIPPVDRERLWVTEDTPTSRWIREQRLSMPVHQLDHARDRERVVAYASAFGVLEEFPGQQAPGWFRPRMVMALRAGAIYATRWQAMTEVGHDFTLLPHVLEGMTMDERDVLAMKQFEAFRTLQWSPEQFQATLQSAISTSFDMEEAEAVS